VWKGGEGERVKGMDGCMDEKKGAVTHKLYMMVLGWKILDLMDV
jgi:hypothetical protein